MKKYIYFLALVFLLFTSCKKDGNTNNNSTSNQTLTTNDTISGTWHGIQKSGSGPTFTNDILITHTSGTCYTIKGIYGNYTINTEKYYKTGTIILLQKPENQDSTIIDNNHWITCFCLGTVYNNYDSLTFTYHVVEHTSSVDFYKYTYNGSFHR